MEKDLQTTGERPDSNKPLCAKTLKEVKAIKVQVFSMDGEQERNGSF